MDRLIDGQIAMLRDILRDKEREKIEKERNMQLIVDTYKHSL